MGQLKTYLIAVTLLTIGTLPVCAQDFEIEMIGYMDILSSSEMHGRGYVNDGKDIAARFIMKKFKDMGLRPVSADSVYAQGYDFPVNYFPGKMYLDLGNDSLRPGVDFLIDAASSSFQHEDLKVKKVNMAKISDTASLAQEFATVDTEHAYYLTNMDDFCENTGMRADRVLHLLPSGCYIVPEDKKLTWTVSRDQMPATVYHVKDAPKKIKRATARVDAKFDPANRNANIIGQVPGEVGDTFIVFTAHYDHLGRMGRQTYFPGASDNASGTAMLMALAKYFAANPQHYSMLFIAFAGEEAGLMGSEFYTWKPLVPLANMKFLINLDIMGDAEKGVTVVNATKFPREFELLQQINEKAKYVPEIKSRGPAANSDQYYFTEAGVHSFFIYSNGGKGYYHDVFDAIKTIKLTNVDGVGKMLIDFVKTIR